VDAVAVTLVVLFAAAVAANVGNRCQVLLGAIVERKTRLRMLEACANVDVAQFEDAAFHDLMERVDANALDKPAAVTFALADLASGALGVLPVVGALVVVQPLLVPVLLLGMLPMVVLAVMGGRNEVGFAHERAATDRRRDYLRRVLVDRTAAKELRLFNASHALLEMLRSEYDVHLQLVRRHSLKRLVNALAVQLAVGGMVLALLYFAFALNRSGRLTVPQMAAAVAAVPVLLSRIGNVTTGMGRLFESTSLLRDLPTLEAMSGTGSGKGRFPTPAPDVGSPPEIGLQDVTFTYPSSERPAIQDVSLVIPAGKVSALVGANGSGKTTLVKLIAQLYRPQGGCITWNGLDVSRHPQEAWREHTTVLFQDFIRYELSLRDNVTLGRPHAQDDASRLEASIRGAGLERLGHRLPNGLDTVLSKAWTDGVELSGGEWQTVALARAYFRNAALVVLDEPTAALDPRAEYELFRRIRVMFPTQTIILVSHRLNSVRPADQIFVLADGRLAEQGTHDSLLQHDGVYAEFYKLQEGAPPDRH
jgi:ATP-binding cassette subfamily B protein